MIMERGAFLWLFVWTIQLRCDVADVAHDGPRGNRAFSDLAHARCTRDGQAAPCLDVESCERSGAAIASNKSLVVVFHDCHSPLRKNGRIERALVANAAVAARDGFDYAWAVPPVALRKNDFPEAWFGSKGVAVMELPLPWLVPPNLSAGVPVESGGCCGAREFIKLQFLMMTQCGLRRSRARRGRPEISRDISDRYSSVVVLDSDVRINEDVPHPLRGIFDCAASGLFLTSRGSHSGANGGFLAARPDPRTLDLMLDALSRAVVTPTTGWNGVGFGPFRKADHPKFDARVQGFLYWFLYQTRSDSPPLKSAQVDPCVYNSQHNLPPHLCTPELCTPGGTYLFHGATEPTQRVCAALGHNVTAPG